MPDVLWGKLLQDLLLFTTFCRIPCPPEVGLRFAQFMDMVRESAGTGRCVTA